MVVEEVVLLDGQLGLVLQLLQLVPLRVRSLELHAVVVPEDVLVVGLEVQDLLDLVDVLADELGVPQRLDLLLEKFDFLVFLVDCVFEGLDVGRGLLEQPPLLDPPQLHLLVGELLSAEYLRDVGDHGLVVVVEGLAGLGEFQLHRPVLVDIVAHHGVPEAALAQLRVLDLGLVLGTRNVAAEVHFLQLDDVLQLLDLLLFGVYQAGQALVVLFFLGQLLQQLLFDVSHFAV